jgi:hypothetical protein
MLSRWDVCMSGGVVWWGVGTRFYALGWACKQVQSLLVEWDVGLGLGRGLVSGGHSLARVCWFACAARRKRGYHFFGCIVGQPGCCVRSAAASVERVWLQLNPEALAVT